jgi:hypothetical protein
MASTIKLQDTLNWCGAFISNRPTTNVSKIAGEPALTSANKVKQTILSAPFAWSWNRNTTTITTVVGTQDYSVALSDFGYIEKATVSFGGKIFPVQVSLLLPADSTQQRPDFVAAQSDDNAGNITFRFQPVPDQIYSAVITYQKAPTISTALTGTWSPIPDRYSFIYESGLLAHMCNMFSPERYQQEISMFYKSLVSVSEGLTDSQKAIFLEEAMRATRTASPGAK